MSRHVPTPISPGSGTGAGIGTSLPGPDTRLATSTSGEEREEFVRVLADAERPLTYASVILGLEAGIATPIAALLTLVLSVSLWPAIATGILSASLVITLYYLHVAMRRTTRLRGELRRKEGDLKDIGSQLTRLAKGAEQNERRHIEEEALLKQQIVEAQAATAKAEDVRRKLESDLDNRVREEKERFTAAIESAAAASEAKVRDLAEALRKEQSDRERQKELDRVEAERRIAAANASLAVVKREIEAEKLSTQRAALAPILEPFYRTWKPLLGPMRYWVGVRNRGAGAAENIQLTVTFSNPTQRWGLQNQPFFSTLLGRGQEEVELDPSVFNQRPTDLEVRAEYDDIYGQRKSKAIGYKLAD